jgi:3-hydroxybutyryl-CoA dehydrogenase
MPAPMPAQVTVLGAGTMGHGIALLAAREDHPTRLYDVDPDALDEGEASIAEALQGAVDRDKLSASGKKEALDRLSTTTDRAEAVEDADVVIEAVPEDLELKRDTFRQIEEHAPAGALLATNTSSLSIEAVAEPLDSPERVLGMHFFNPPYIMDLVEVIHAHRTSEEAVDEAVAFAEGLGKDPILVRDTPGFASSRLGVALGLEAIRMVQDDVAEPEAIDKAMTEGYNHPMGPLELTDMIGLDTRLEIADYLYAELGERFEPPDLLEEMVEEGKLGKKTGEGFYAYD